MRLKTVLVTCCCLGIVAVILSSGCILTKKPDLVPFTTSSTPGAIGYCQRSNGQLVIMVKNQGNATAPASTTLVEFTPGGQVFLPTPAIPEGEVVDLTPISIPAEAWNPDADFNIAVDTYNVVNESEEGNNEAQGMCLG